MKLKKGKFLGAILLSLFLLSSCRSLKNTNTLFQSEYDRFADTAKSVYVANPDITDSDNSYKIKPFDIIAVRNLQNPEGLVNTSMVEGVQSAAIFRSDKDGIISLPVIGPVNIKGLTQFEAAKKIQELYGKTLLRNPIIELTVVNLKVTLLGEVGKPGNYQLERENLDLIDLLGKSGGLNPSADVTTIKIIRGDLKNPEIIYVNLKNINSLASNKLTLKNNDIIYVNTRSLYTVTEKIKSYSGIIQPAFLILNAILLIYTVGR